MVQRDLQGAAWRTQSSAMRMLADGLTVRLGGAVGTPRAVVKDLIDVAGLVTTGGCAALMDARLRSPMPTSSRPSERLARRSLASRRCMSSGGGTSGINAWSGTPRSPLDPGRIPG